MKHISLTFALIILWASSCWAMSPAFWWAVASGEVPAFTGLFYTGFENETDDAKVTTVPEGWNDDYTTVALAGTQSAFLQGSTVTRNVKFNLTSPAADMTTLYVRSKFRISNYPTALSTWGVGMSLFSGGTDIGGGYLQLSTTAARAITASVGSTVTTDPTDNSAFSSGTYYLYIIYTPGTSLTFKVMDSAFNLVDTWSVTKTSTQSSTITAISIWVDDKTTSLILDDIEVRNDTNWGS